MKIEIIYGELANLLGEHGSQELLRRSFGEDSLIRTPFPDRPAFMDQDVDLVYMGPMTERTQRLVLEHWRKDKEAFRQAIDRDVVLFLAGNALDLVGRTIRYVGRETVEALGLYPFDTVCQPYDRFNQVVSGFFDSMPVMGFRSQFTTHTGDAGAFPLLRITRGRGMNADTQVEGIRDRNFFATDLLGPFLILNPDFTRLLFKEAGFSGELPFEEQMRKAAEIRFQDFEQTFYKKKKSPRLLQTYLQKENEILGPAKDKDKG